VALAALGEGQEPETVRKYWVEWWVPRSGGDHAIAFGSADFYVIFDVPDNISAAALSVVANQSGFVTSKIIVLMTADEMDQEIKKAMTKEYLPPGE